MTGVDWIIVGVVLLSVLLAAAQGFFFEVFSLGGAILGYLLAAWEYTRLAPKFLPYVKSAAIADLVGFLTIFFAFVLLAGMVGRLVRWTVAEAGLRWIDRLLGAAFGLARGLIVITVAVLALAAFAPDFKPLADSELARYFLLSARGVVRLAPAEVQQRLRGGLITLRALRAPQATAGNTNGKH